MKEPSVADRQDSDLLKRIGTGDETAFKQLYATHYDRLFRFIYHVTRRLDLVEDLINETMLVVWNRAETFEANAKVSTWICGIAYRKALKALAQNRRYPETIPVQAVEETLAGTGDSAFHEVDTDNWLEMAMSHLSADQRAVIELTYYHELHYKEIAAILGCPENTVKTRMFHIRKKLQALRPDLGREAHRSRGGNSYDLD